MRHRHLNHEQYTLAAIDDTIQRGKREDWAHLRRAALADQTIMEKIVRVCDAYADDRYRQRHQFWRQYATRHLS